MDSVSATEKWCSKCGETKPLTEFGFDRNRKDGRNLRCKPCVNEASRAWTAANVEKSRESKRAWKERNPEANRQWAEANPERARAIKRAWAQRNPDKAKAWHEAHPERVREIKRAWAQRNPESARRWREANRERRTVSQENWKVSNLDKVRAYHRAHYLAYKEHYSERTRKWLQENQERARATKRAWRMANSEILREKSRARYEANKERWKASSTAAGHRRRALLRGVPSEMVRIEFLVVRDRAKCQICGKAKGAGKWSIDHILPVSKGGANTYANTRLAHLICNVRRNNRGSAQLRMIG